MYFLKVSDYETESFLTKAEAFKKISIHHLKTAKASLTNWPWLGIEYVYVV